MLESVKVNYIKIRTTLAGTSGGARANEGSRVIRARATEVRLYNVNRKREELDLTFFKHKVCTHSAVVAS